MVAEAAGQAAHRCRSSPTSPAICWPTRRSCRSPSIATRPRASAFPPQAIDDTLNDAFGQRQITQYFTQLKTYFVVLEILPDLQKDLSTLDRLYVKSPLTGGAVPLSALVDVDSNGVGPLSISHQGQFPAVTITFNLRPGVALGQAVDAVNAGVARNRHARRHHPDLPGQRPSVPDLAEKRAGVDRRRR